MSASTASISPEIDSDSNSDSDSDVTTSHKEHQEVQRPPRRVRSRNHDNTTSRDILLFLIAFRILNALSIKTFFQPDEFFQSLEPAWEWTFGANSGAWITWASKTTCHSASIRLSLTWSGLGMEEPAPISNSSGNIRWRVLALVLSIQRHRTRTRCPCRSLDSGAQGDPGDFRSVGGLLYLEAWRKSVWAGQQ